MYNQRFLEAESGAAMQHGAGHAHVVQCDELGRAGVGGLKDDLENGREGVRGAMGMTGLSSVLTLGTCQKATGGTIEATSRPT